MKKKIAILSLLAIFAVANTLTAQTPAKAEKAKTEAKACCKDKKADAKDCKDKKECVDKKADKKECCKKAEEKACCKDKKAEKK